MPNNLSQVFEVHTLAFGVETYSNEDKVHVCEPVSSIPPKSIQVTKQIPKIKLGTWLHVSSLDPLC